MRKILYTGKILFTSNKNEDIIHNFAILTGDERILWVGKLEKMEPVTDCERVDLGDVFVMPGLIDAHVHIISGSNSRGEPSHTCVNRGIAALVCRGVANAKALLRAGVVACRDLGSVGGYALGVRDSFDAGEMAGPKMQTCGYAICATGGHGHGISYEADGREAMVRCVRQVVKDGGDVVKLMVSGGVNSPGPEPGPCELTMEEIQAGVDAAHALGRKVAAHTHGNTAIRRCVEAGVDSVEHGVFLSEDIMEMMKKKGTFLVPTLSAPYYAVKEGLRNDPGNPNHKKSGEVIERHRLALKRCAEIGVKIAMGTDAGCPYNPYSDVPNEMILMHEAGLSPTQVLLAATISGAELLGIEREFGSIEAGKRASFLIYRENLVESIEAAMQPHDVIHNGYKVD